VSSNAGAQQPARVVLVSGGAGGLGRGLVVALARDGDRVAFTYRPGGTPPAATLALARAHEADVVAIAADHLDPATAPRIVAQVEAQLGPIDVLVHVVGPIVVKRFARCAPADYREMIEGNLGSAVALASAVLPGMRERRFGRLVFFGMNGSHVTQPARGMALYGAAKAAVVTFARTLALEEAAFGITVNVVEPGDIREKDAGRTAARAVAASNPTGHAGSWEDVADAVRFATRNDGGFLNGMVIGVNGGLTEPHE
jgi:3-oxoacyl-[acyl-carrier protein] reductase